ncbi:hypothetical protein [Pseudomonas fluorescens]|uniref:hypothetical protein n=1 Tax=Pseudomonas fluorescens TaxID=294 RepID=UPI001241BFD4|nr:hypothetical protein [Pseudomonas fluorescens]
MSRTYDHESGEAVDEGFLAKNAGKIAAAVAATAAVPVVMNSADTVKVAGKILTFIGKNPKVALGVAAFGVVCYGIHRLTEPGTKIKKTEDGFEYERSQ